MLLIACLSGCEKDDICVDGDTPLLIINFYNSEDPSAAKNVTRLRVIGLGNGDAVGTFSDRSNLDSIGLPLRSDQPSTGFVMIRNSQDDSEGIETGNRDTLYFDYALSDAFISRACGFVTNYVELQARLQADASPWIDSVRVVTSSVQSIQTTHVAIYH
ncbi:hypothetical protein H7F20_15765 [Robiginitalea sp. SC105]|nr:hypothetical protein [Robiginitalea sp. SC105]